MTGSELIADVEPSRQSATLHDAWRDYARKAARPYAWSTFAKYARERLAEAGEWRPNGHAKDRLTPWQDGNRASPRVLVLGAYAALRVRDGALEIEHGPHDDRQTIRIDIDSEPKPPGPLRARYHAPLQLSHRQKKSVSGSARRSMSWSMLNHTDTV